MRHPLVTALLALVVGLAPLVVARPAHACTCAEEIPLFPALSPAPDAHDVALDAIVICPQCRDDAWLELRDGDRVEGTWSVLEINRSDDVVRLFTPRVPLLPNRVYDVRYGVDAGRSAFTTGTTATSPVPDVPKLETTWTDENFGCFEGGTNELSPCHDGPIDWSVLFEVLAPDAAFVVFDVDCESSFNPWTRSGHVEVSPGYHWVGPGLCTRWGEEDLGRSIQLRFGALGANGAWSGFSDPIALHFSSTCEGMDGPPYVDAGVLEACLEPEPPVVDDVADAGAGSDGGPTDDTTTDDGGVGCTGCASSRALSPVSALAVAFVLIRRRPRAPPPSHVVE